MSRIGNYGALVLLIGAFFSCILIFLGGLIGNLSVPLIISSLICVLGVILLLIDGVNFSKKLEKEIQEIEKKRRKIVNQNKSIGGYKND